MDQSCRMIVVNRLNRARVAVLPCLVALSCAAVGQTPRADATVAKELAGHPSGRVNLIVRTTHPLTTPDEKGLARIGAYVYRHLSLIRSVAISVPGRKLAQLARAPFVEHLSTDGRVHMSDAFTVGHSYASSAWSKYSVSGKGVGVAVIDTGIATSADFAGQITGAVNLSPDANTTNDLCGHGTQVAGLVAGNGANSSGKPYTQTYYGIAPKANLINVRVLDAQGNGAVSQVIEGITWAVANRFLYNIRVINLSLGHTVGESYTTDPLCLACEAAWKTGLAVVVAAGNDGRLNSTQSAGANNDGYGTAYATITVPGNDPYVITVGAMKQVDSMRADDTIASYSSRGPSRLDFIVKPDIVAPGNMVTSVCSYKSTDYSSYLSDFGVPWSAYMVNPPSGMSTNYFTMSGTSMSAPVVSGAIALMLQKNALLSPDTVKVRLMLGADKWTNPDGSSDIFSYGAGFLDIPAAVSSSAIALGYAMSPSSKRGTNENVLVNPVGSLLSIIYGILGILDFDSLQGEQALWGEGSFSSENTVSNSQALWGEGFWSDDSTYDESTASTLTTRGDSPYRLRSR